MNNLHKNQSDSIATNESSTETIREIIPPTEDASSISTLKPPSQTNTVLMPYFQMLDQGKRLFYVKRSFEEIAHKSCRKSNLSLKIQLPTNSKRQTESHTLPYAQNEQLNPQFRKTLAQF